MKHKCLSLQLTAPTAWRTEVEKNDFTKRLSCQKEEFADGTGAIMCMESTQ